MIKAVDCLPAAGGGWTGPPACGNATRCIARWEMERTGKAMPDNPKTGVLTAMTMADDLLKIVRSSDW